MPLLMLLADVASENATQQLAVGYGWLLVKMIVVLVIVCCLAVLILKYLVPKLGAIRKHGAGEYISIVARRSLDHKQHVWIITVGKRHFLLGSGDGSVTCLSELSQDDIGGGRT